MHHRGQLMMLQRMIGLVPHLTRQMQERMAQMQAAATTQPRGSGGAQSRCLRANARVPARAEAQQPARVVHRARKSTTRTSASRCSPSSSGWRADFMPFAPEIVATRRRRSTGSTATRASPRTRRRTRPTSRRCFRTRGLPKHEGAGLYFHVSPDEVWVGGGMYAPQPHAAARRSRAHRRQRRRLRALVESPGFRRACRRARRREAASACRAGFPKDHEAAEYLKYRQFLAGREFPPALRRQPEVLRRRCSRSSARSRRSRGSSTSRWFELRPNDVGRSGFGVRRSTQRESRTTNRNDELRTANDERLSLIPTISTRSSAS